MFFYQIDPNMLVPDGKKKYVKLVAQFSNIHRTEKVMAVSFRSGHIFIQTDKPIYNPGDKGQLSHAAIETWLHSTHLHLQLFPFPVRFRAFVSDLEFHSSERTITLEIQVICHINLSVVTVFFQTTVCLFVFFWNINALQHNLLMFQNPDGIAVHGVGRVKAIDGVFSDIFSLSTVVKYVFKNSSIVLCRV